MPWMPNAPTRMIRRPRMAIVASRRVRMERRLSMAVFSEKCSAGQGLAREDATVTYSGAKCARVWRGTDDGRADGQAGHGEGRAGGSGRRDFRSEASRVSPLLTRSNKFMLFRRL